MILEKKILILEDDLRTLSKLLEKLARVENDQPYSLSLIVLTDHTMVEEFINKNQQVRPDIILLDRDCKLGGSFHVLELERLGPERVISISSVPDFNDQARKRGVKRVVRKDYAALDEFANKVAEEVEKMLMPEWLK